MNHLDEKIKSKLYAIISKLFSNNYSLKVHQKIIDIAKQNLIEISYINNLLCLKIPEQNLESQFSFLELIRIKKEKNYFNSNLINKINFDCYEITDSLSNKFNNSNNNFLNSEDKKNTYEFNNTNNYLNVYNELKIQRISNLNIYSNEQKENLIYLNKLDEIDNQDYKFKNIEIDLNKIFEINKEKIVNDKIDSDLNKEELKLNTNKSYKLEIEKNNKSIIQEEEHKKFNNKDQYNPNLFKSNKYFKEYQEKIFQSISSLNSMITLLEKMILYKDNDLFYELLKRIKPSKINSLEDYQNKIENDIFNFSKGFIFQNYINNAIVMDPINNFPKKGFSILFSFKFEPLNEIAMEGKCDLFYLLESKILKNEKDIKDREDINNLNDKVNYNCFNHSMNDEEFNKSIKISCYILNGKIYLQDSIKLYKTNIDVIPGVSYVILIDQKESSGFVKKISKVFYFY